MRSKALSQVDKKHSACQIVLLSWCDATLSFLLHLRKKRTNIAWTSLNDLDRLLTDFEIPAIDDGVSE